MINYFDIVTQSHSNLNFQVRVHVTLSHGEQFSDVHSPSALWVHSVTSNGFDVCIRESGTPSNGSGIINWLAFQDRPDIVHGSVVSVDFGQQKPDARKYLSCR